MTSPRWQFKLFLISLPFTRRTISNYLKIRYHKENRRKWEWGWSPPPSVTKTDHIRRGREAATSWPYCPSPKPVKDHVERSPLILWFLRGCVWGGENLGDNQHQQHYWSLVRAPTLIRPHRYCRVLCGLSYWECGKGLQQWAYKSWGTHLICPSSNPNQRLCSFAEPDQWCTLASELQIRLIWILKMSFAGSRAWFAQSRQGAESQPHLWRVSPGSIWPQGLATTRWSCVVQGCLSREVRGQNGLPPDQIQ